MTERKNELGWIHSFYLGFNLVLHTLSERPMEFVLWKYNFLRRPIDFDILLRESISQIQMLRM